MNLVFLDIETAPVGWRELVGTGRLVPEQISVAAKLAAYSAKPPGNYTKPETIERWRQQKLSSAEADAAKAYGKFSLDSKFAEIVCVGLAYGTEVPHVIHGASEGETLIALDESLSDHDDAIVVSHGGRRFDWPFIWERATGHKMGRLAARFYEAPYWARRLLHAPDPKLLDTRELWNTTGPSSRGLLKICEAFGICQPPPDAIDGSQVLTALLAARADMVNSHCFWDIKRLQEMWYRHLEPSIFGTNTQRGTHENGTDPDGCRGVRQDDDGDPPLF